MPNYRNAAHGPRTRPVNEKDTKPSSESVLTVVTDMLLETIREAGPNGIPSGHLYAALMGHLSLDSYNAIIGLLKKAGKVKESYYVLTCTEGGS